MIDIVYHCSWKEMGGRATQDEQALRRADKCRALQIQPEVRKLLDLIAEELAAEYLRLVRTNRERVESEGT
jgi:hypothetical protein